MNVRSCARIAIPALLIISQLGYMASDVSPLSAQNGAGLVKSYLFKIDYQTVSTSLVTTEATIYDATTADEYRRTVRQDAALVEQAMRGSVEPPEGATMSDFKVDYVGLDSAGSPLKIVVTFKEHGPLFRQTDEGVYYKDGRLIGSGQGIEVVYEIVLPQGYTATGITPQARITEEGGRTHLVWERQTNEADIYYFELTTGTGVTGPPRGTVLTAESRTVAPGGAVQVPIMLDNAQNVGSLGFQLSYDPAVVQVVNVPKGALLAPASFTSNTQQPGLIIFGFATTQAVSGDGSAAIVEFKAVGAQGSSSALTLSQVEATDASGASVSVEMFGGQVTIGQLSQGDINGDNKVSALDALRALRMYVQLEAENLILDMNGNGRVTPEDARLILEMAKPK